jgi:hypothetical protein
MYKWLLHTKISKDIEEQYGFKNKGSVIDLTFTMSQIMERKLVHRKKMRAMLSNYLIN